MTPERREEIRKSAEEISQLITECDTHQYGHDNCIPRDHVEQFALDVWDEAIEECASISVQRACGPECHLPKVEKAIRSLKSNGEK